MSAYEYSLPIEKYGSELLNFINKHKRVVVKGPTGCGKSTFIPLLFKDKRVAIIEPRRIAVTALYGILKQQVPNIGFKMRFNQVLNSQTTTTIFTDGSFLNEISFNCKNGFDYDCIIIDEIHERTIRTDIIIGILKESFNGILIMMSATLNTSKLEQFMNAKTFNIPGSSHPVIVTHLERPTPDYIVEAYMKIKQILKESGGGNSNGPNDILVFLPGEEDINDLGQLCSRIAGLSILRVHSRIGDLEQRKIFERNTGRRVVLSTNICETSLTIPNIKYVIDTGLTKIKVYDGISRLGIVPESKESEIQRTGRCNRLGPGVCYRLYTDFNILPNQIAEIKRVDLSSTLLRIIGMDKSILTFPFLDYPSLQSCVSALDYLADKKCIEIICNGKKIVDKETAEKYFSKDQFIDYSEMMMKIQFKITPYGKTLLRHPFEVNLADFYEQCIRENVGYYGSILVSLISQEDMGFMGSNDSREPDIRHLIKIMEEYLAAENRGAFALEHGISQKGLETARRIFKSLNKSKVENIERVERIFSKSFSRNLSVRNGDGSYTMVRNNMKVYIHPSSGFFKRHEKKIVLVDLFEGTKTYARVVGKYYQI